MNGLTHAPFARKATWAFLALGMALFLTAAVPGLAWGLNSNIEVVDNDSFAPEGYDWHFDFTGVESERGFVPTADISQYYSEDVREELSKEGDSGFAALIDGSTSVTNEQGDPTFALRYTGGTYTDDDGVFHNIDAIVELTGWKYLEYETGFKNDPYLVAHPQKTSASGVFVNNVFSPNSAERQQSSISPLTNFNFYTVELSNLTVEVIFVESGTNTPVRVKGHTTCSDLDVCQAFSFSGGISSAQVCQSSQSDCGSGLPWLSIDAAERKVTGNGAIAADDSDSHYQDGMVTTYFDTGTQGLTPLILTFYTSLFPSHWVSISFFSMTSEYLANPPKCNLELTKAVDKSSVLEGDTITYTLSTTLPREGRDVRVGYRLSDLAIADEVPPQLTLTEKPTAYLNGKAIESGCSLSVINGVLEADFDKDYLQDLKLDGQTLTISFSARVDILPDANAQGKYLIENTASVTVNDEDPIPSNTVTVEVTPLIRYGSITVTKRIKADEVYWQHGNPTFVLHVTGKDAKGTAHTYAAMVSFTPESVAHSDGYYVANHTFSDIPVGVYEVSESPTLRYVIESVETSGSRSGDKAVLDLSTASTGTVTFTNAVRNYQDGSHCVSVKNHVSAGTS